MGFSDNLKNVTSSLQQTVKNTTISLTQRLLRIVTGFFLGLVLALIIQQFTQCGTLMLVFMVILFMLMTYKILRMLSIFQIFIFDVICILIAISLRMYIMIAP